MTHPESQTQKTLEPGLEEGLLIPEALLLLDLQPKSYSWTYFFSGREKNSFL